MSQPSPQEFAAIFEDDRRGAAILEHLVKRFTRPAELKGGIDAVLQTYYHAGQRRVLDFIVSQINQSHGVDVNQEEQQ